MLSHWLSRPSSPALRRLAAGGLIAVFVVLAGVPVVAHDLLYPGTVLEVQADKLHVKTVDPDSREELLRWFVVTEDTKVKRGDSVVTYAAARIAKDERIVVVVSHENEAKGIASELRLAVR